MNPGNVRLLHGHEPSEALCPFVARRGDDPCVLSAEPQRPFKPLGLMLWGVGDGVCVQPFVGTDYQLIASFGSLPARWFTTAQSFAEIVKMLDEGKQPPSWGQWKTVTPGVRISLRFLDQDGAPLVVVPTTQALMWGVVPHDPDVCDRYEVSP